jgi:hypothetical protein
MAVIDFSRWNTLPWWKRNGFKTREEAWAAYNSRYCTLSAGELEHQQRMAREINQKARNKC